LLGAGEQTEGDTGDGGVDTGVQHAPPPDDEDRDVPPTVVDVEVLHDPPQGDTGNRAQEPPDVDSVGEEDRDDDDGPEIVGDGQCE
ncbi:MAG: hypothetical protein Q613_PSC00300G0001, partial [Propionibacterium sp. DORA_15]